MKVMIADGADDVQATLGQILADEGYTCFFVNEGRSVIDRVYSEEPDIIFLSAGIAKPCCLRILERLKAAPSTRDIPVLVIGTKRGYATLKKAYLAGAYDYVMRPFFKEEVVARIRNITYIRKREKELAFMMDRDFLTGLYNRKFFMERMNEELAWAVSYSEPLSLMMLDIDHFKKVNDTYGHRCGDDVLKKLSLILLSVLRREDVGGRYGGEEFIVLMSNTDTEAAAAVAEKLRAAVQAGDFSCEGDVKLSVTISAGIATFDALCGTHVDRLIGLADSALYVAKEGGRNRVCIHGR
jgi:diguanylate cyclase (GGDEF)-like protein